MDVKYVNFNYKKNIYPFYYDPKRTISTDTKVLYFGHFSRKAPGPLQTDTTYCLKMIMARDPALVGYAALRDCYDLLDFNGAHLRQILLRDDVAEVAAQELKRTNHCAPGNCMVIEPCYKSAEAFFQHCNQHSVKDRLDVVKQYAIGSRELGGNANRIDGRAIMAHRDLKWENGVVDPNKKGIHIRLVDFATIWLEGTRITGTQVYRGTKPRVLSPENTSPESIMNDYPISEKTDVYALGMMLASLFVRHNGKYVNPSTLWCLEFGWGNNEETTTLRNQMQRCSLTCDGHTSEETWIERDLRESRKISLSWEHLPDPQVEKQIRRLFNSATRINPADRITRNDFIKKLEMLIAQVNVLETYSQKQPVSVYLFDRAGAGQHREDYLNAARNVFQKEQEEAIADMGLPPQALCVSFCTPAPGVKRSHCLQLLASYPYSDISELEHGIQEIRPAYTNDGNLLLYAIYRAYDFLCNQQNTYRFTGNVYIFCPKIPSDTELTPFSSEERDYDLEDMIEVTLGALLQGQVYMYAHTGTSPDSEAQAWCEYELFSTATSTDTEQQPISNPKEVNCGGYRFDKSNTAVYVPLPNGNRLYVSLLDQ